LQLDASPFEERLEQLWSIIAKVSPEEGLAEAEERTGSCSAAIAFGADLIRTYARLADFAGCVAALCAALKGQDDLRRCTALVRNVDFLRGLRLAAKEVSIDAAATQAKKVWSAFLAELQGAHADVETSAEPRKKRRRGAASAKEVSRSWWAAALLQEVVRGLQPSELSIAPLRDLTLQTFTAVEVARAQLHDEDVESLTLSLCVFGRRLGAWDLPWILQPARNEAAELAAKVSQGLRMLLPPVVSQSIEAVADRHVDAAVQFLALLEQGSDTNNTITNASEASEAVAGILWLAKQANSVQTPGNLKALRWQVVCTYAPLLLRHVAVSDKESLQALVAAMMPEDWECWQHVSRAIRSESNKPAADLLHSKVWSGSGMLWASGGEAVAELPQLRGHVIDRFSYLGRRAISGEKKRKHGTSPSVSATQRLEAACGIQAALVQLPAAVFESSSGESILGAVEMLKSCGAFSCCQLRQGGASLKGKERSALASLLALSLETLRRLLRMQAGMSKDLPDLSTTVRTKAIAELMSMASTKEQAEDRSVLGGVAAMLMDEQLAPKLDFQQVFVPLAALTRDLLAQPASSEWKAEARTSFFSAQLRSLIAPKLSSKPPSSQGPVWVSLPAPGTTLKRGQKSDGNSEQIEKTKVMSDGLSNLLHYLDRAESDPLSGSESRAAFKSSIVSSLRVALPRGFGKDLRSAADCKPNSDSMACVGYSLQVMAQCWSLSRDGVEAGTILVQQEAGEEKAASRAALLELVEPLVQWLSSTQQQPLLEKELGFATLKRGISTLIHSLCCTWPAGADEDEWHQRLLPILAAWTQTESTSTSSSSSSQSLDRTKPRQCWLELATGSSRQRQEAVVAHLTASLSAVAMAATKLQNVSLDPDLDPSCEAQAQALQPAAPLLASLATVLRALPNRLVLRRSVASEVVSVVQGLMALIVSPLREVRSSRGLQSLVAVLQGCGEAAQCLFVHLSAPLASKRTAMQKSHQRLADAEAVLLHLASQVAEIGLRMQPQAALEFSDRDAEVRVRPSPEQFGSLLASAHSLLSALFSALRIDGARLPSWARKPHVVVGILKQLLEGVYQAWDGEQAVQLASNVTRLWEAYTLGGSRLVPRAAARRGGTSQVSYQGRMQKATRGFVMMLLSHALEQQRRWVGMDAAVQRSLKSVPVEQRQARRNAELARWKEAVSILQVGLNPLFQSLEGSDHIKQCLYMSLREPVNDMFKEAHAAFKVRGQYKGEA